MENIKRVLSSMTEKMDENIRTYTNQVQMIFSNMRQQLDALPSPPALDIDTEQLARELAQQMGEGPQPEAPDIRSEDLKRICIEMDSGATQVEVLTRYLKGAGRYASRAGLFILKGGEAVGWRGVGFSRLGGDDDRIRSITFPLAEGNPFYRMQEEKNTLYYVPASDDMIVSQLEGPQPKAVLIVPVIIKDKVAAALYADAIEGDNPLRPHLLEILTYLTSLAILLLGQRQLVPSPSLTPPEDLILKEERISRPTPPPYTSEATQRIDVHAMEELEALRRKTLGDTAKAPAPAPEEVPVAEEEAPAAPAPEEAPQAMEEPSAPAMEMEEVPSAPEMEMEEPPAPPSMEMEETPTMGEEEYTPAPVAEMESVPSEPEVEMEEVPEAQAMEMEVAEPPATSWEAEPTAAPEPPPATEWAAPESPPASEWATPEPAEEVAPPPPPPEEPAPEAVQAPAAPTKTSTEVKPPPGFTKDKPGFGFESISAPEGMSEEDAQKHDEARRFARLLISEIKLYNEARVKEGRGKGNIYELLKEDIDRSYQLYKERIPVDVRSSNDYFKEALVSILAEGQASALGELPF